ncbi:DUF4442 domain-containing protein [Lacinutrix neustonica]|uniref:DUF4442 domain-containing protein n=1 Tax=Lacinutrix neustonica TaxID=2980107 RepID=A0A9E8MYA2_9FLAO|nr:DUF4442 domain-containing protein [Lacinutrix neustonica]WAC03241.1 DUF4442 domain-containing protein [Lacinutrix neustonica]
MTLTPRKINMFNALKLPSVYLMGVRVTDITKDSCAVKVKHRWLNQNPFKSMFWAVQGMAAELTTGAPVLMKIKESGEKVSMLVSNNNANFSKKATGKITFECKDGHKIDEALKKTIESGEGETIWMQSIGTNEAGVVVSTFNFEWSVKVRR